MAYTKLFSTIVTSTVWGEPHTTRIVWITMLATANKDGEVMATIPGLARLANVTIQETEEAVNRFLAPDPYSRTPDDGGRRIEKIEGGWQLLNYQKYRRMASLEEAREQNAERQRRHRERAARNASFVTRNASVTHEPDIAEAEAEAEEKKKQTPAPSGASVIDGAIESIYAAYPRKVGKLAAIKAIRKALKDTPADVLLDRVNALARTVRGKDPQYIPHPSTWFNEGRYLDEPARPAGTPVRSIPSLPEPPDWQAIIDREFPQCAFASQHDAGGRKWAAMSPGDQAAVAGAVKPFLPTP